MCNFHFRNVFERRDIELYGCKRPFEFNHTNAHTIYEDSVQATLIFHTVVGFCKENAYVSFAFFLLLCLLLIPFYSFAVFLSVPFFLLFVSNHRRIFLTRFFILRSSSKLYVPCFSCMFISFFQENLKGIFDAKTKRKEQVSLAFLFHSKETNNLVFFLCSNQLYNTTM